ncbi:MAG: thioredoxin domain-containing protein [Hydrogenophaga sp.]|jgi:protein-disulfide isomerase|uniref:DsbA family protein n=1 Tax=Hydrogenophaga sp. TaxID=1904254 RepID=UPI001EC2DC8A|nr:thioredoxin domain-containing protein [Hydrogenophaga sp.]MBA4215085.1 disulfide bond formation protein DsbA [Polaromonas sp.]MBX9610923.1 thioredoxin domain-containing protein [Burkholderiales bacterium]MDP3205492.1 thioredoxin domain-containing protein [Hydrogenophaga sp.]MDZ4124401.1 thioredoxin domain-containing protein [Hydrogenophaga sp.]MDZ4176642.1 thioredoxin domain-containing protein [Hydrogenophaga sp.]
MNAKKFTIIGLVAIVALFFYFGMNAYQKRVQAAQEVQVKAEQTRLVRMHSPVFGPQGAPVTIVEFFDPACETCRAFYPIVKNLMAQYPNDVRLVIRYAPFHQGSDQVVKLLESAKSQGKYQTVLEAVLAAQPTWADHGQPNIETAFKVAEQAGLDLVKARQDIEKPGMQSLLQQDIEDLTALQVTKTPTFFVNGRSLPSFGPEQLAALVAEEVAKAKK